MKPHLTKKDGKWLCEYGCVTGVAYSPVKAYWQWRMEFTSEWQRVTMGRDERFIRRQAAFLGAYAP